MCILSVGCVQSGRMALMFQWKTVKSIIDRPAFSVKPVNVGFQEWLLSVSMFLESGRLVWGINASLLCKSGDRRKGKSGWRMIRHCTRSLYSSAEVVGDEACSYFWHQSQCTRQKWCPAQLRKWDSQRQVAELGNREYWTRLIGKRLALWQTSYRTNQTKSMTLTWGAQ